MSESVAFETPTLTAAEKAEIRRRKILAKKNARMAYAAGKRTALPSEAPSEPITGSPGEASTSFTHAASIENSSVAQHAAPDGFVAGGSDLQPRSLGARDVRDSNAVGSAVVSLNSKLIRLTLLTLLAIAYTAAIAFDHIPQWRVSAVELFSSAELCLLMPGLIDVVKNRSSRAAALGPNREAFPFTVLRLLTNIQDSVLFLRRIGNDFSVFLFVFLCAWYSVKSLT